MFLKCEVIALSVKISNSGTEISQDNLGKIFNKFYQCDESHASEGNGIGLSIVRAIMNNYGNDFGVSNKENGVEFYFEVDIKKYEY